MALSDAKKFRIMRAKLVLALVGEWMATNKDSILVTNRDDLAQNKRWNKFVSKLIMCTMLNRRTHQRTESLEIVFLVKNCLRRLGNRGFGACSVVPCCLHSCDQPEYLVLQNNSFSFT